jgi:uncharacterized membrane protein
VNWPYIHTLINHFPIILTVVGTAALALALITSRRTIWIYALATLTLAGLTIYPAYLTGDQAADALRNTWYIVRAAVREHDGAAGYALVVTLIVGAASALTWWRMVRDPEQRLPPVWWRSALMVLALFGLSIVARTAYLGGEIVHDAPALRTAPAGFVPDSTAR